MNDEYCAECHSDVHASWTHSVHRFSSFNNPPYLFSVRETRRKALRARRHRAGGALLRRLSRPGAVLQRRLRRPELRRRERSDAPGGHHLHRLSRDHPRQLAARQRRLHDRGAAALPVRVQRQRHCCAWINRQLVKAKPEFHKKTFLKPLHKTTEFCGACHKVHLPEELNDYKWLRGQNHYDSFLLSGVSGHGVSSFYYPPRAEENCNGCHMQAAGVRRISARGDCDDSGELQVHDHQFPSANTALAHLLDLPAEVNERTARCCEGSLRVDLFGLKRGRPHRRRTDRAAAPVGAERRAGRKLPAGDGAAHADAGPPVHPGHGRLERSLAGGHACWRWRRDRPPAAGATRATARSIPGRISSTPTCSTATATASIGATPRISSRRCTTTRSRPAPRTSCTIVSACPRRRRARWKCAAALHYRKFDTKYMRLVPGRRVRRQ